MNLRQTASSLEKITHKFTRELNELSGNAEHLKYKSYVEERNNCRSGSGEFQFQMFQFQFHIKNVAGFFLF